MKADRYDVNFTEERAEIIRIDSTLLAAMEIVVSAEDDAAVSCLTVTDTGTQTREVEVT